ncbi:MAG TPA: MBOAT family protein [Methylomirabilota bacterium]|nr:MBOAT family protein [Methylomirabilota bacterium]
MISMEQAKSPTRWKVTGWLPLAVLPAAALAFYKLLVPWAFMWILAVSIYAGLKWLTWWSARNHIHHQVWCDIAYLLAWPGMDAEAFLRSSGRVSRPRVREWLRAVFVTCAGAALLWIVSRVPPPNLLLLRGWIGMLGLILLLHFGTFQIVALFWQNLGVDAQPIMSAPLHSHSLSEFWGKRWNLGFRELAHDLIFAPLHRRLGVAGAGFLVFVVSGLIHDLVISLPARGGYGLPTFYFALQGIGVALERSSVGSQLGLRRGYRGWLFMASFAAAPVYFLFHPPFVLRVIIPFIKAIHAR